MALSSGAKPVTVAVRDDAFAAELRGFGVAGVLTILAILAADVLGKPASALVVLAWAWRSRTPWHEIGLGRPRQVAATVIIALLAGAALKVVMKALVMPLLGAPPVNEAYQFLEANRAALPSALYALFVGAAFGEEVLFRGFLFERLRRLMGDAKHVTIVTLLVSSVLFGLAHYANQGWPGVQQGFIMGLAYGALYVRTGSLLAPMVAHAAFDLVALWMIYNGLELRFATFLY